MIIPGRLRRIFRTKNFGWPGRCLERHTETYVLTCRIIRLFYAVVVVMAIAAILFREVVLDRTMIRWIWSVSWIPAMSDPFFGKWFVLGGFLASSIIALFCWKYRWARLLIAVFLFETATLFNSFGKISHYYHGWVLVSLFFVFFPTGMTGSKSDARVVKHRVHLIFWGAQAMFLLTYTMTGLGKILGAFEQFNQGAPHSFSVLALPLHIATVNIKYGLHLPVAEWMINHPGFACMTMYLVIYLETFSIWVAFRPDLHRLWAIMLIGMHVVIYLTMHLNFIWAVLLLLVLFWKTPLQSRPALVCAHWNQVPLLGFLGRLFKRSQVEGASVS